MPKISVCSLVVPQVRPNDTTEQSRELRWRSTDVSWMMWDLNLRAPNYQISAPFVGYKVLKWERTFAFWRSWFDSVMENEMWLGWDVQLWSNLHPLPFPLKPEFSNCSMYAALTMSVKYSRSQTRHLLNELWKSTWGLEEVKGCCMGEPDCTCKLNPPREFCSWQSEMQRCTFPLFLLILWSAILNLILLKNGTQSFTS